MLFILTALIMHYTTIYASYCFHTNKSYRTLFEYTKAIIGVICHIIIFYLSWLYIILMDPDKTNYNKLVYQILSSAEFKKYVNNDIIQREIAYRRSLIIQQKQCPISLIAFDKSLNLDNQTLIQCGHRFNTFHLMKYELIRIIINDMSCM